MKFSESDWRRQIGFPEAYTYSPALTLLKTFDLPECIGELYSQTNGPGTSQRVMMLFPKRIHSPVPGVVVSFYYPEAMMGMDPFTGEKLPKFAGIEMMLHLVRRGYAVASADAYHLTYIDSERERDHPRWTGIGKLTADTKLLTDALASDSRVDEKRLGIAGHSLGGKMAFYAGCLDTRIRVILASDFGIRWEQTNWKDPWYWGDKAETLQACGMEHSSLLAAAAPKPVMLLAGQYDDMSSWEMMRCAAGYENCPEHLAICHHASGHRPPPEALEAGYEFLDRFLR